MILFALGADPVVGKEKAPNFTLVDINGKQFSLSDHLGKVVLLDLFATWCGPCIFQIEYLKGLYDEYSLDQLVILSISVDPDSDTVQVLHSFAQQNEMTWTVARDTDNIASKYEVSAIPHLVIIDAEGYKRHSHLGLTAESTLSSEIGSLLSEIGTDDSNGDPETEQTEPPETEQTEPPETEQTEPPYTLMAAIGVGVIVFLVVGVLVARKRLGRSKRARKRRSRKRKR
jgi:peroxiredoxin